MIFFQSILTTFEERIIFLRLLGQYWKLIWALNQKTISKCYQVGLVQICVKLCRFRVKSGKMTIFESLLTTCSIRNNLGGSAKWSKISLYILQKAKLLTAFFDYFIIYKRLNFCRAVYQKDDSVQQICLWKLILSIKCVLNLVFS